MTLWSDPKYKALAKLAAQQMGSTDGDIIAAILAQWTCEKGNADAYPPSRNNPGNLARGAAQGLGYPFHIDYPNPQPSNPIVTFDTPQNGSRAYGKLIATGSRYRGVMLAVHKGDGYAYIKAMGASGYGTSTACMLSAYHPPAPQPPSTGADDMIVTQIKGEDWKAKNGVLRTKPDTSAPTIVRLLAGTVIRSIAEVSNPGSAYSWRMTEHGGVPAFFVYKHLADNTIPDFDPVPSPGVDQELTDYIARK